MIKTARINAQVDGEKLDITVKNNPKHVLAPTWELVMGAKNKRITWAEYEERYIELLRTRWNERQADFIALLDRAKTTDIYLVCFCTDERYCHRRLAKEFLQVLIENGY